jgi:hypothetical protein
LRGNPLYQVVVGVEIVVQAGTHGAEKRVAFNGLGNESREGTGLDLRQTSRRADRDSGNAALG